MQNLYWRTIHGYHRTGQISRPAFDRHPRPQSGRLVRQGMVHRVGRKLHAAVLIVEADSVSGAIDELADNKKYGRQIVVSDEFGGVFLAVRSHEI